MIIAEFLKEGGKDIQTHLKLLVESIWKQEKIPNSCHVSVLCPIHKKGNTIVCQNYRGISLLNITLKILSNITLNQTKTYSMEIIK